MSTEPQTPPAGAQAGQPNGGSTPPAADTAAPEQDDRGSLRQRAIDAERRAQKLESQIKADSDKRLADEGKHRELAELKTKEAETYRQKLATERRNNALIAAAHKLGYQDVTDALALVKLDDVDDEDPVALGTAALTKATAAAQAKPYLLRGASETPPKTNNTRTSTAPPGGGSPPVDLTKIRREDVSSLSNEDKQRLVNAAFGQQAGSGFFRKG